MKEINKGISGISKKNGIVIQNHCYMILFVLLILYYSKDCFLIFGVSDKFEIIGIGDDENRKTQTMVIDTLSNSKFAGDNKSNIQLESITIGKKKWMF